MVSDSSSDDARKKAGVGLCVSQLLCFFLIKSLEDNQRRAGPRARPCGGAPYDFLLAIFVR